MKRNGSTATTIVIATVVVTLLLGGAIVVVRNFDSQVATEPVLVDVKEVEFVWTVLDQGVIASSDNAEIYCEVESKDSYGTPVLEVVPEGTLVSGGDIVAKLDDAALRLDEEQQLIKVNTSDAALAEAESTLETAEEEQREYFEGTYLRERQNLENELFKARQELTQAREYYEFSRRLWAKGFISDLVLEGDEYSVKQAEKAVELALTDLRLLQDHTRTKKEIEFRTKIYSAKKALENATSSNEIEKTMLKRIQEQIDKCVVKVPEGRSGQVVYPDRFDWRTDRKFVMQPGAQIRENETIVLIPNPDEMQVEATVNESSIIHVKEGMEVTIKVDALQSAELRGRVTAVSEYAEQDDWFSGGVNKYAVEVEILDPPPELKPGMNASIEILVERTPNSVCVPVQAVMEFREKHYALVQSESGWETREVTLGESNARLVKIVDGLQPGEQVALSPRLHEKLLDIDLDAPQE